VLFRSRIVDASIPVVMNVDATPTVKADEIRRKLLAQIDHAVLWEDSLRTLFGLGADRFLEIGAGRVLSGLVRRTDKTKKFANIEDKKSADAWLAPAASL
jgi:[acyl-carrier-protein] S-malonyltransferase